MKNKKKRKFTKAQIAFEFMLTLGFVIIILLVVMSYFNTKTSEASDLKTYLDGKRICEAVANNINIVVQEGDGYFKNFSIPEDVYWGHNYTIVLCKDQVYINWGTGSYYSHVFSSNIVVVVNSNVSNISCESSTCSSFSSGCNLSAGKTEYMVSNKKGKIYIYA